MLVLGLCRSLRRLLNILVHFCDESVVTLEEFPYVDLLKILQVIFVNILALTFNHNLLQILHLFLTELKLSPCDISLLNLLFNKVLKSNIFTYKCFLEVLLKRFTRIYWLSFFNCFLSLIGLILFLFILILLSLNNIVIFDWLLINLILLILRHLLINLFISFTSLFLTFLNYLLALFLAV